MRDGVAILRETAQAQAGGLRPGAAGTGAVVREVWSALGASGNPMTVRELAAATGVRRDSVARALRMLEHDDQACRERGDVRRGIGDLWRVKTASVDHDEGRPAEEVAGLLAVVQWPGARAAMRTACVPARGSGGDQIQACPRCGCGEQAPRRLAKGELEELLVRTLQARVGESFGVVALARMTGGHSQGAVANACERLARRGTVQMIYKRSREYTAVG